MTLVVAALVAAATGSGGHASDRSADCETRAVVDRFVSAFNRGSIEELDRLVAMPGAGWSWYSVADAEGRRRAGEARDRSRLMTYFARRHRQQETLRLVSFRDNGDGNFEFELLRRANDLAGGQPVSRSGKGHVVCESSQLGVWSLGGSPWPNGCPPGDWIRSAMAAWLRRVVEVAGYTIESCTGSAWIAATPRTRFYIWAAERTRRSPDLRPYNLPPLELYTDGTRLSWQAQGMGIWVSAGPNPGDMLPGRTALSWLLVSSRRLPRVYRPLKLMPTPPRVLARCRSDVRLRPACPRRIPRIEGWETYPRKVDAVFGIQLGGEIPGKAELMRPPGNLHVEVAREPDRWVPFRWPIGTPDVPRDGLVHEKRDKPIPLGSVRWGGRSGTVALAPGYPTGGSQGGHVMFRWRERGTDYVVGMHAWEPFTEAYATLRRIVVSLPPRG